MDIIYTAKTIGLDLDYHIRHIKRYADLSALNSEIPVGVRGSLLRAIEELERARASLLDGLDRV